MGTFFKRLIFSKKIKYFILIMISISTTILLFQNAASPRPHFKKIWLEPNALVDGITPRDGKLTKQKLIEMFRKYKEMDIGTVVIAYSESLDQIFYPPKNMLPFKRVADDGTYSGSTISSNGYNQVRIIDESILPIWSFYGVNNWADPLNTNTIPFLDAIFAAAAVHDIKIILGLSKFTDKNLVQHMDSFLLNPDFDYFPEDKATVQARLNERLGYNVINAQYMAFDLYTRYAGGHTEGGDHPEWGPQFAGFYLPHEPHCLDIAMNYIEPVARYIKGIAIDKKIMISPNADAEVCFSNSTTAEEFTNAHLNFHKSIQGKDIVYPYSGAYVGIRDLVDIIAYQDSVGSGYQNGTANVHSIQGDFRNMLTPYLNPGPGYYHSNDMARSMRINYLKYMIFPFLKSAHDQSGIEFWINTEYWRMDGSCLGSTMYGCNFPGTPDFGTGSQLDFWSGIAPDNLMLNEASTQFDFEGLNLSMLNSANPKSAIFQKDACNKARTFTNSYRSYLASGLSLESYSSQCAP